MTSIDATGQRAATAASASLAWAPGASDLVFGLVLATVLVGGRFRLLNDPGTFWHLRLGRDIAATGAVPRVDTLTYTHSGVAWVDQSWLYDLGLAGVVQAGGLGLACLVTALVLAGLYAAVCAGLERDGRPPLVALTVGILAAGVGATHFLVRPHVLTLLFVWLMLRICHRHHERGGWSLAMAPWLTVLWANVHGGFLAGPIIVATALLGEAVSGPWTRERARRLGGFGLALVACLLAGLATPYGLDLYRHVATLLVSSGVTDLIQEYQPIPFGKGDARVVELVILGLIAVPLLTGARMTRYELTHTLVWLHLALASIRHAPIFALAAAPGLARVLEGMLAGVSREASPPGQQVPPATPPLWFWPAATAAILLTMARLGTSFGELDEKTWPLVVRPTPSTPGPLFHEQDWGGLVEAELGTRLPAFVDDRFELFGRAEILAYLNALEGGPAWDDLDRRWQFGQVWVRPDRPLARRLRDDRGWTVLFEDDVSILLARPSSGPGADEGASGHEARGAPGSIRRNAR